MTSPAATRVRSSSPSSRYYDWIDELPTDVFDSHESHWDVSRRHDPMSFRLHVVPLVMEAEVHAWSSYRSDAAVAERFERLRDWWKSETMFSSSVQQKVMHPAYQEIIGLGPQVVPHIVEHLRTAPDHWFWALRAIVGEDHASGASTPLAAAEQWIAWFDSSK